MTHPPIATAGVTLVPQAPNFVPAALATLNPQIRSVNAALARQSGLQVHAAKGLRDYQRGALAASLAAAGLRGAVLAAGVGFLGGAGLVRGIEIFLGLSAQFERTMNTFQAVTHATAAELKDARAEAIALGKDITLPSTSASDAADAMTELARGGLDVQESMDAARGSLQLAAAASVDFAAAAKITARAVNAFDLSGAQATRVADILANAANISTGEITDMALSLQQAGAVAHASNIPIEDTAAAISILANAGLTGSDAGTSLRTMLLRLIPQTKKAREEMKSLGVETTDTNGQFLPLSEIIQRYHDALKRLSPEQRNLALQTIFGQDAIRASNILFSAGAQIFNETRVAVSRQGAAAEIAAAKNKGLAGTFDALRSNVESVLIGFGKEALPGVTAFVRDVNASITSLSKSATAANTLRSAADGIAAAFHGADAVLDSWPVQVLAEAAVNATKLANAIGGGPLLAGFLAFKAGAVAARAYNFALENVVSTQAILNNEARLTRSTQEQIAAGAGKWTLANTALVASQIELEASIARVAQVQAAGSAATIAAATQSAQQVEGIDLTVASLTGYIAAEQEAVVETEQLALSQTKLSEATLAAARASEQARQASLAGVPVRGAGGQFISKDAIEEEARLGREAVKAEIAVTSLGTRITQLGSTALAFVGGPLGLISLGLAAATTAFIIFGGRGKTALEQLDEATADLARTITDLAAAQDSLARARLDIKTSALSVEESKLNLAYAKGEVIQAQASGSAIRLRAARLNLRRAELDYAQAIVAARKAQSEQVIGEAKLRGQQFRNAQARNKEQQKIIDFFNEEKTKLQQHTDGERKALGVEEIRTRTVAKHVDWLRKRANEERADTPVLSRQLELIAELEERTKRMATPREISLILRITTPDANATISGLFLGDIAKSSKQGQEAIGDAMHNLLTEVAGVAPKFRDAGDKLGRELARGLAEGIETDEALAEAAARRNVQAVIAAGRAAIAESINQAKSNLFSIGAGLSEQISQLIDAGPVGSLITRLQDRLDRINFLTERARLISDKADAIQELGRRKAQLDPLRSAGLTPEQKRRRAQDVRDFLKPAQDGVRDATNALRNFNTQHVIDELSKAQQKQKETVQRGLNDLIAQYEAGAIDLQTFQRKLASLLEKTAPNYKHAGSVLGIAFGKQFEAQVKGFVNQAIAISQRRFRTGVPGVNVERPLQAERQALVNKLEAQRELQAAIKANTQKQKELTQEIFTLLKNRVPPRVAQGKVAKDHNATVAGRGEGGPRRG